MRKIRLLLPCLFLILLSASFSSAQTLPFDEYGDVGCEDEMARLDNFAVKLRDTPNYVGYAIVYGGRDGRRGEALARAARIKDYLIKSRGLESNRVMTIDGGYREKLTVDLWIVPSGESGPKAEPTIQLKDVRFKRGKIKRSAYRRCQI